MAEAKKARTPDYVRKMPQYGVASEVLGEASAASRTFTSEVVDEETAAQAANVLTKVSKAVKKANKERLAASEPYRQSTSTINEEFNEMIAPLEGVEERLREELKNYNAKVKKEEREAQQRHEEEVRKHEAAQRKAEADQKRKAEEAAKRAEPPPPPPAAPPPPPPPPPPPSTAGATRKTEGGSVSGRTEWKHEVFDPAMVPEEYKRDPIDHDSIRKAVKAGERNIPGVRIYPEENVHVR